MTHSKTRLAATKWPLPVRFLVSLWAQVGEPGQRVFISTKRCDGRWSDYALTLDDVLPQSLHCHLTEYPPTDYDWYFTPTPFTADRRVKANAAPSSVLWSDVDDGNWKRLPPSLVWRSSPGRYQALWLLDHTVAPARLEAMSRAAGRYIGGDKSGWDLTQVLRIPGTWNHKYSPPSSVARVVVPARTWAVGALERKLGPIRACAGPPRAVPLPAGDLEQIARDHRGKVPRGMRSRLRREPRESDDRSAYLWKVFRACLENGVPKEAVYQLVKDSPWNKWGASPSGLERLRGEIQKAYGERR